MSFLLPLPNPASSLTAPPFANQPSIMLTSLMRLQARMRSGPSGERGWACGASRWEREAAAAAALEGEAEAGGPELSGAVLTEEQVERLGSVLQETFVIHGRGNFPLLRVPLRVLIGEVRLTFYLGAFFPSKSHRLTSTLPP